MARPKTKRIRRCALSLACLRALERILEKRASSVVPQLSKIVPQQIAATRRPARRSLRRWSLKRARRSSQIRSMIAALKRTVRRVDEISGGDTQKVLEVQSIADIMDGCTTWQRLAAIRDDANRLIGRLHPDWPLASPKRGAPVDVRTRNIAVAVSAVLKANRVTLKADADGIFDEVLDEILGDLFGRRDSISTRSRLLGFAVQTVERSFPQDHLREFLDFVIESQLPICGAEWSFFTERPHRRTSFAAH